MRATTPCLLVDEQKMNRNIARVRERLGAHGVPLRPHVKTAKALEPVARMAGDVTAGITVSTLGEAEFFAEHGYRDILYAVGTAPAKVDRLAALADQGVRVSMFADGPEQVDAIAARAAELGGECEIVIEVDTDDHRAGVSPDGPELLEVAARIDRHASTALRGVATHAGGSYDCRSVDAIRAVAKRERDGAVAAAARLRDAGYTFEMVSVGSTPTATFGESFEGVTEVRAGVFVFQDLVMAGLGVCELDDIALSVMCTVIGHQKHKNWLIVDAGWTALSRDRGTAEQAVDQSYGVVCDEAGRPIEDWVVTSTSQEHGVVTSREGRPLRFESVPVGARLRVLPNHACATASAHAGYHVVDFEGAIADGWSRCQGW